MSQGFGEEGSFVVGIDSDQPHLFSSPLLPPSMHRAAGTNQYVRFFLAFGVCF